MQDKTLSIDGNLFLEVPPGVFEVPLSMLGSFRLCDMHSHSTIVVKELPDTQGQYELSLSVTQGGKTGTGEFLSVSAHVGYGIAGLVEPNRRLNRAMKLFDSLVENGIASHPLVSTMLRGFEDQRGAYYAATEGHIWSHVNIYDVIIPFVDVMRRIAQPESRIFICHASEDKPIAVEFAEFAMCSGAEVWLDQWEISVGDSIVEKIVAGLGRATHLAVLLSKNSVDKPWVKKEMSASLMRQLRNSSVTILPIVLDECEVPSLLADIKYADCRNDKISGFRSALEAALMTRRC
jgi:hypothetical protein